MILSIENHCTVPQQKKMAEYLVDILGEKLDLSSVKADESGLLPSPDSLKSKILVKVKKIFTIATIVQEKAILCQLNENMDIMTINIKIGKIRDSGIFIRAESSISTSFIFLEDHCTRTFGPQDIWLGLEMCIRTEILWYTTKTNKEDLTFRK